MLSLVMMVEWANELKIGEDTTDLAVFSIRQDRDAVTVGEKGFTAPPMVVCSNKKLIPKHVHRPKKSPQNPPKKHFI